jgi:hypothetical protein
MQYIPKVFFRSYPPFAAWQRIDVLITFLYEHDHDKLIGRVGSMPQDHYS